VEGSIGVGSSVGFPDVVSSGGSTGCVLVDVMITTVVLVVPSSVDVIVVTVVDVGVVVVSVVEVSSSEEVVDVDEVVDVVVDSGVLSGSEDVDDDVVVEGTVVNVVDGGSEVAVDDGSVDGGGEGGSVDGSSGVVVGGWGSGSGSGVSSGGGADVGSSDTVVDMLEVRDGADVRLADVVGRADGEAADVDGPTTMRAKIMLAANRKTEQETKLRVCEAWISPLPPSLPLCFHSSPARGWAGVAKQ
jgi:hypothetical protein